LRACGRSAAGVPEADERSPAEVRDEEAHLQRAERISKARTEDIRSRNRRRVLDRREQRCEIKSRPSVFRHGRSVRRRPTSDRAQISHHARLRTRHCRSAVALALHGCAHAFQASRERVRPGPLLVVPTVAASDVKDGPPAPATRPPIVGTGGIRSECSRQPVDNGSLRNAGDSRSPRRSGGLDGIRGAGGARGAFPRDAGAAARRRSDRSCVRAPGLERPTRGGGIPLEPASDAARDDDQLNDTGVIRLMELSGAPVNVADVREAAIVHPASRA
jgi:hypothetical protein